MRTQSHCPVPLPSFAELLPLIVGSPRKITQGESHRQETGIYVLPDNVLLEIFDSCKKDLQYVTATRWKWCFLAHVCRRWRQIVFESPQRLNLQIHCTYGTPVRKSLGIWPPIPIAIDFRYPYDDGLPPDEEDNVMAALEHPGRVCYLRLRVTRLQLEKMATVMQEPFPALTHLNISLDSQHAPVLPAEFLGGSAPRLHKFHLTGIPFPALPTLLMSASNLVFLFLQKIPPTGYISPEAMVACLATLHRLETFVMKFQLATLHLNRIHSPPTARTLLPALTRFVFEGASEYLEDLVVQINTPQLDRIIIDYHYHLVDFQVTQLSKFIDRSVGPKLRPFGHACVNFFGGQALLAMYREEHRSSPSQRSALIIVSCEASDWNFSQITQVLSEFSATLSNVVHLELSSQPEDSAIEDTGEAEWLHLLHQFSTVKTLRVSQNLARHLALALDNITWEMVDGFLPSLDSIFLEGQSAPSIEKFLAARQLSGRPVTVIDTETEFNEILTP